MPWVSRLLRGDRVWVRATPAAALATGPDGRVDIVYSRKGGKVYRAAARNLEADSLMEVVSDEEMQTGPAAAKTASSPGTSPGSSSGSSLSRPVAALSGGLKRAPHSPAAPAPAEPPIIVYADGACSGNPGPSGIGIVILDGDKRDEVSENLGTATNNIAELMAIVRALEKLPRYRTVIIHSDSSYALGLLGQGWKAKANQELVQRMRALASEFRDLRLVKVAGHAGVVENERADALARAAVSPRR